MARCNFSRVERFAFLRNNFLNKAQDPTRLRYSVFGLVLPCKKQLVWDIAGFFVAPLHVLYFLSGDKENISKTGLRPN